MFTFLYPQVPKQEEVYLREGQSYCIHVWVMNDP